ncbi:MAG: radical SAM protein [Defluviitaleaceae bacterium]|nr:radical SAM protein [Defluviitaleaceae bacterium]
MKLIRHMIPVELGNGSRLLINSLNGLMDEIDDSAYKIVAEWQKLDKIVPGDKSEVELYDNLLSRGYLVSNDEEEVAKKNKVVGALRNFHQKNKGKYKHITFIITYNCNFRCPYCYEGDKIAREEVMTNEMIDAALDVAGGELESVGLFGGEPLMPSTRQAIEHLVSRTKDKPYNIITNGYYLVEYFDLLSQLNIEKIMVTLDGDEDTHNSKRYLADGGPTFQKIMQGIEKFLDGGIPICIRMNIDGGTLNESKALRESLINRFSKHEEMLSFEISPMFHIGHKNEAMDIFQNLYKADLDYSGDDRQQRNTLSGRYSPILNSLTVGSKMMPVYSFCYAHSGSTLLVDPYGDIFPCLVAVGNKELSVGSYFPEVVFKENSIYNRNIETIPKCSECVYSLLCGGGCPIGLDKYDDILRPVCHSIHKQIHVAMPMVYKMNNEAAKIGGE